MTSGSARAPTGSPLLQVLGVTVRFGGVTALDNVSVDFLPGEICGVIGPNGAGKTTLFDTLSGVRQPTAGKIIYDTLDMKGKSVTWRSRHGMRRTFQRQQTFGWLSVEDNLMAALEWRGGKGGLIADVVRYPPRMRIERIRRQRVREVLELCGISEIARVPTARLPLGKARLVEMARAVVDHPRIVLLDEPTSGLEEAEVDNFAQFLKKIRSEEGCTVVVIEHDVGFVMRLSERVLVLNLGSIVANGLPGDVRKNPEIAEAYFGS